MRRRLPLLALFLAIAGLQAQERAPQNNSIHKEELRADLFFLASDAMRGRLTDTPENRLATEFIRSRFDRLGLKAPADGSFFQTFNMVTPMLGQGNEMEIAPGDGMTLHPAVREDFFPHTFSANARARGAVVFAGFGLSWPERGHDDFPADQIKGRIVLVLSHEPGERDPDSPFDGLVTSERAVPWRKALAAQQKGAIGILFVDDVHNHTDATAFPVDARAIWPDTPPRLRSYTLAEWVDQIRIPAAQISRALASTLVVPTGRPLEDLARAADQVPGFTPVALPGIQVQLNTAVTRQVVQERNVVGLIEGSDARLKDEWIIVSSHLDHDGVSGDEVYSGADDNASGTAGVLEIAEAYALAAKEGRRPRRSVLLATWNAEERGLLGSWAYTEHPLAPLARTVAVLNMDMIGRNEEIPPGGGARFLGLEPQTAEASTNSLDLYGYSRWPQLAAEIDKANAAYGLTLKKRNDNNASNLLRRSDHWPFLHRGVPAIFFHTGLHPDYHTPSDRPEKVNYDKMEKIVRLVHTVSWTLANRTSS